MEAKRWNIGRRHRRLLKLIENMQRRFGLYIAAKLGQWRQISLVGGNINRNGNKHKREIYFL